MGWGAERSLHQISSWISNDRAQMWTSVSRPGKERNQLRKVWVRYGVRQDSVEMRVKTKLTTSKQEEGQSHE